MPTYTVHAPPLKTGDTTNPAERFVFVRDGFHFYALLFAPLWLLTYRLWLALALYVLVNGIFIVSAVVMGAPEWALSLAMLLFALLVGLEASTLRRWKLTGRGWKTVGFVVGDDQESAEQRFFAEWVRRAETAPTPPHSSHYTAPVRRDAPSGNDVIGLFPEPELKR